MPGMIIMMTCEVYIYISIYIFRVTHVRHGWCMGSMV